MELSYFDRDIFIKNLETEWVWDILIIGGGATGSGVALDSASRGFKTLLLEGADFAKGTSGRSTKLIHGGVRYLSQGNIRLVYRALHERELLFINAPHLVKKKTFIIPCYHWLTKIKYFIGLKLYDLLAGNFNIGKSKLLNKKRILDQLPTLDPNKLVGGVAYSDGQFDDARMALNIAQTAAERGASVLNYFKVRGFLKDNGKITGVIAINEESKREFTIRSKVVINATGVFVDEILRMDEAESIAQVRPSQGVHLVVDKKFLNSDHAMMIPNTSDGRVLFAVPWHNKLLLGTTDTLLNKSLLEPVPLDKEIDFILDTVGNYLTKPPERKDILSMFAGLRPLAITGKNEDKTKEIPRDHKLIVSHSGLVTITGGKWTTYRKMSELTVDKAIIIGELKKVSCSTKQIKIHGSPSTIAFLNSVYGSDQKHINSMIDHDPSLGALLIDSYHFTIAEVIFAVRFEMARNVEDVLARRIRLLFLDAGAAIKAAPKVARIIAGELDYDQNWESEQIAAFKLLASNYLISEEKKVVWDAK